MGGATRPARLPDREGTTRGHTPSHPRARRARPTFERVLGRPRRSPDPARRALPQAVLAARRPRVVAGAGDAECPTALLQRQALSFARRHRRGWLGARREGRPPAPPARV